MDVARQYASERVQFGKPISQFQEIRFKIAKAASEIEACRQLMYHACAKVDSGERADLETSMVKYLAAEMAEKGHIGHAAGHGGRRATPRFIPWNAIGVMPA